MGRATYDVVIVGAGPAGIFSAFEIYEYRPEAKVLILDKGREILSRNCPITAGKTPRCIHCRPCSIMTGWGGAGAFSDGKFNLTADFGGWLTEYIGKQNVMALIRYVDSVYLRFGAPEKTFGTYDARVREIEHRAAAAGLKLIPAEIRHLGTEKNYEMLTRFYHYLKDKIEIRPLTGVAEILVESASESASESGSPSASESESRSGAESRSVSGPASGERRVTGVRLDSGEEIGARFVICAPGRDGAEWFRSQAEQLGLKLKSNQVDIGVRVEVPAVVMEHLTDHLYESKLIYYTRAFDDQVRTFCVNPFGEVVLENTNGLITVNGHSYSEKRTSNTNFALLVSKNFTEPFKEPIRYGKYIASLANMLGDGVIVQRLGDLMKGRRSTADRIRKGFVEPTLKDATPGDLSLVLPHRHLVDITEMLGALDKIAQGVASEHTLLYGVEVKFYSSRLELDNRLESRIRNLFAAGDGAGITRGLSQASASGVLVAREVVSRL